MPESREIRHECVHEEERSSSTLAGRAEGQNTTQNFVTAARFPVAWVGGARLNSLSAKMPLHQQNSEDAP
jgi:hypothetical protein